MSYIALYRKWRPLVFEDVVEQEHVVKTLKNSVITNRIAHAYLFCGTRGTGKTTMAKIFSRAINCPNTHDGDPCNECEICKGILSQSILDVIEIDAASNNSVDNVREIRDEVIYAPSQAKYKVYIIDEVHMLSSGAFNALLKTLEEPPAHVVFILATTEPHKLPATILSRCQRFDFRRISVESIMDRLEDIAKAGEVSTSRDALRLIAKLSDGALRDAISILDQCMSLGKKEITYNDVLNVVGIVNDTFMADIVHAINCKDANGILRLIDSLILNGKDVTQFVSDLIYYYRNLLICKVTNKPEEIIEASVDVINTMTRLSSLVSENELILVIRELSQLEASLKWATYPRILLEVSLLKICRNNFNANSDDVFERLALLEEKIQNGDFLCKAPVDNNKAQSKSLDSVSDNAKEYTVEKNELKRKNDKQATSKSTFQTGKYLEVWDKAVTELRKSGRMALYTNLIGSRAVQIDDKVVGIVFGSGSSFNKMLVSKPENAEVVEAILTKLLGREIRVKCIDEEDIQNSQKSIQLEEKDEFIEKAQEITKRLNVPVNIIDG